jgi:hypothetical protein
MHAFDVVFAILLLIGGLMAILGIYERFEQRPGISRREAKALQAENVRLRQALQDVRRTSATAITTGDPVAHELNVVTIDRAIETSHLPELPHPL